MAKIFRYSIVKTPAGNGGRPITPFQGLLSPRHSDFIKIIGIAPGVVGHALLARRLCQHRVDIQWWGFSAAVLLTLAVASGMLGRQSVRAARGNPVEALGMNEVPG